MDKVLLKICLIFYQGIEKTSIMHSVVKHLQHVNEGIVREILLYVVFNVDLALP